uniref:Uncharacterized protein n=1 Tax=Acidobacterium capsulatum TaxID=33075 RepID=A0A7V4XSN2_9BACT
MTDQERKMQRAHLLVELQDAEDEVVHLRERLHGYADALDRVTKKLRLNATLQPSRDGFHAEAEMRGRLMPEEIASVQTADKLVAAIEELRQAQQRLFLLRERNSHITRTVPI